MHVNIINFLRTINHTFLQGRSPDVLRVIVVWLILYELKCVKMHISRSEILAAISCVIIRRFATISYWRRAINIKQFACIYNIISNFLYFLMHFHKNPLLLYFSILSKFKLFISTFFINRFLYYKFIFLYFKISLISNFDSFKTHVKKLKFYGLQ